MIIDRIRQLHRAEPFRPFRIDLSDSRSIDVARAENLAIGERSGTIAVASDGVFDVIDLQSILTLELVKDRPKTLKRKKRKP